ncbi:hypothetical protein PG991_003729 [Apiospora marii]|uniref:Uncharacterized protein n=1 Tax=Apiospora marii TaxID=335849 RepID=A0ABR1S4I2_9PEZI
MADEPAFRRHTQKPIRLDLLRTFGSPIKIASSFAVRHLSESKLLYSRRSSSMADHQSWIPPRPATPQTMIHRLPDKPDPTDPSSHSSSSHRRPAKYIVLLMGSTAVAGKVQIATTVAQTLACPLYQGDSLHESSAKAAGLGADDADGPLVPEESRPANEGFSGFGGGHSSSSSSAVSSRRGSGASVSDASSSIGSSAARSAASTAATQYTNRSVLAEPDAAARERRDNPALLVLTHPPLEAWHRAAIRGSVGEYGVGVVFVPLYRDDEEEEEEDDLPVLKPLDPRTMTGFASFDQIAAAAAASKSVPSLDEEIVLRVNVEGQIEELIREIVKGARDIMAVR